MNGPQHSSPENPQTGAPPASIRESVGRASRLARWIVACACLITGLAVSAQSTSTEPLDAFYERLYQEGSRSAGLGQHDKAVKDLRLACFGMLEQTDRLGDCLARLALSQIKLADKEGFLSTIERLMEVEQRFQGYTRSGLSQVERRQLETWLEEEAPLESYANVPAFSSIAESRRVALLRGLPAEERQKELDRIIARDPRRAVWRVLRGELMLEQGRAVEAGEIADRLTKTHPADRGVACLRGRSQGTVGACDPQTLDDLARCDGEPAASAARRIALSCYVGQESWSEADRILALMSPEQRAERSIRALEKEIRRGRRSAPAEEGAEPVGSATPASEPQEELSNTSDGPDREELALLSSGWQTLRSDARDRFEGTYDTVRALADRYPQWAEAQHLAAELAYRLSLWDDAVRYFRQAESIVSNKPNLQFYLAVALYKSGDKQAAVDMLDRCEPHIQSSDFVEFWVARIRDSGS